jgi:hypothetical protein
MTKSSSRPDTQVRDSVSKRDYIALEKAIVC